MRLAALLTCHNRREKTLECLERLHSQRVSGLEVVVADAGSTDGTADAIEASWPKVQLLRLGDELFWNGGMRAAWRQALALRPDAYLWLNDDTLLDPDALPRLVAEHRRLMEGSATPAILAGTVRDPRTRVPTYGGVRRPRRSRPLHHVLVPPTESPRQCETMNGNVVLVPQAVVDRVGILDPTFTHGMGDFDYGHRARRAGCAVYVASGTYGCCARNERAAPGSGMREAWRRASSAKQLPPREWVVFARRWAGPAWPIYAAAPYVRRIGRAALSRR